MSRAELVPVTPGRPVCVKDEHGWTVFIGVRDAAYLREKRRWRERVRDAHPDKHPPGEKDTWQRRFRKLVHGRASWQRVESLWYAKLGLLPPDGSKLGWRTLERRWRLRGLPPTPQVSVSESDPVGEGE